MTIFLRWLAIAAALVLSVAVLFGGDFVGWRPGPAATAFLIGALVVLVALPEGTSRRLQPRLLAAGVLLALSGTLALLRFAPGGPTARPAPPPAERTALLLSINDVYRIEGRDGGEGAGGLHRVRALRERLERQAEVLLLHAGDALSPSLLGGTYRGRQMVDVLNALDGRPHDVDPRLVAVLGNHEFDDSNCEKPEVLEARIAQSDFQWISANIAFDRCPQGPGMDALRRRVAPTAMVTVGGIRIGIFGLTVDLAADTPTRSFPAIAPAAERLALARSLSAELRAQGAEVVVALTHLEVEEDARILAAFPANAPGQPRQGPDILIGGHDHDAMTRQVNGRWLLKADADAVTARVARIVLSAGGGLRIAPDPAEQEGLIALDRDAPRDPAVAQQIDWWLAAHDRALCAQRKLAPGCLRDPMAVAQVPVLADENAIRSRETNLGSWVAGLMAAAGPGDPACWATPIAFINSGAIRLNADIQPGTTVTRRHLEELFPFANTTVTLVGVAGRDLQAAIARGFAGRRTGAWLQATGLRVVARDTGDDWEPLRILVARAGGWVDLATLADERLPVATLTYLTGANQDGFALTPTPTGCAPATAELRARAEAALAALPRTGNAPPAFAPATSGWVCTKAEAACLAEWGIAAP